MRIRTTAAAAVLAVGAIFGGAGAAVADADTDVTVQGVLTDVPPIDFPDDFLYSLLDYLSGLPDDVCNTVVDAVQAVDPTFDYTCPSG
ncbi:hypothetical protein ACWD4J_12735 [Streptomyces sp. NPDC002577]